MKNKKKPTVTNKNIELKDFFNFVTFSLFRKIVSIKIMNYC